jgi:predicted DsbA family dithiol-disulfide isomerase
MQAPIGAGRAPGKLGASRGLFRLLAVAALSLTGPLGIEQVNAQAAPPMSSQAAELDEFEQRVREYLLKNPEVIMEALQILQQRRRVAPTVAELEEADPDLRLVYKEFPILGPGSQFAARAALASRRQGKYVPFHNALMQATEQVTEETVMETAREAGLDTEQLRADMLDPAIQEAIARNLQLADALGITGTPSFIIGDEVVPGAVDLRTLQSLIARVRREK